jgi:hypothetical protein
MTATAGDSLHIASRSGGNPAKLPAGERARERLGTSIGCRRQWPISVCGRPEEISRNAQQTSQRTRWKAFGFGALATLAVAIGTATPSPAGLPRTEAAAAAPNPPLSAVSITPSVPQPLTVDAAVNMSAPPAAPDHPDRRARRLHHVSRLARFRNVSPPTGNQTYLLNRQELTRVKQDTRPVGLFDFFRKVLH